MNSHLESRAKDPHTLQITEANRRSKHFFFTLARAADDARKCFQWAHRCGASFIPLFDFDVIYGSLPSVVARQYLEQPNAGRNRLISAIGPHSIANLLLHTGQHHFTLPFGTVTELLESRKSFHGSLTVKAESWVRAFDNATRTNNPESTLLVNSRQQAVADVLLDEFISFTKEFDDVRLLEGIYQQHEPFETLVSIGGDKKPEKAYLTAVDLLNARRKGKTRNNRCDAINLSCVVRMFNNPKQLDSKRPRLVPLFISETKDVCDIGKEDNEWYDFSRFKEQTPNIYYPSAFIQVYLSVLAYADYSYDRARRNAEQLANQARTIEKKYAKVLDRCEEGRCTTKGSICSDCRATEIKRAEFDENWAPITQRLGLSSKQDRIQYMNLLQNPHFRTSVRRQISHHIQNSDWDSLIAELQGYKNSEFNSYDLLRRWGAPRPTEINSLADFSVTFRANAGSLLCDEALGRSPEHISAASNLDDLDIRILAHRWRSSCVLCLDVWQYKDEDAFCALVWAHDLDTTTLWTTALSMADNVFFAKSETSSFVLSQFPKQNKGRIEQVPVTLDSVLNPATEYFELSHGTRVLFADTVPAESVEMQFGFALPLTDIHVFQDRKFSQLVSDSSIIPVSESDCRELIRKLCDIARKLPIHKNESAYAGV